MLRFEILMLEPRGQTSIIHTVNNVMRFIIMYLNAKNITKQTPFVISILVTILYTNWRHQI